MNAVAGAIYILKLWELPVNIRNIFFTIDIEDNNNKSIVYKNIYCTFALGQEGKKVLHHELKGDDFQNECIILLVILSRDRNNWRLNIPSSGYRNIFIDMLPFFTKKEANNLMQNLAFRNNVINALPVWIREAEKASYLSVPLPV